MSDADGLDASEFGFGVSLGFALSAGAGTLDVDVTGAFMGAVFPGCVLATGTGVVG